MLPGAGALGEDPRANQDRVVRMLFMAWIVYSLLWHAPDTPVESGSGASGTVLTDLRVGPDGRPVRNMQLFRNASQVALVSLFVPHGDRERLAASLQLSDAVVHRSTPFRRVPRAVAAFYGSVAPTINATVFAAHFGALRHRIASSLRVLSPVNAWALLFKAELGTDVHCVGVCEQGADRHCVGVPDLFGDARCWMPVNDECARPDAADSAQPDCYVLHQVVQPPRAKAPPLLAADMRLRWFANRTCDIDAHSCGAPIARLRGDVARAVMYAELAYGASQSADDWLRAVPPHLFDWADADPVDDVERRRHELLHAAQQTRSPFVDFELAPWRKSWQHQRPTSGNDTV